MVQAEMAKPKVVTVQVEMGKVRLAMVQAAMALRLHLASPASIMLKFKARE